MYANIIVRNNKYNEKGIVVNNHLKCICIEKNMFFINHTNNHGQDL